MPRSVTKTRHYAQQHYSRNTYFSVENFLLSVAHWLDNFEESLKQSEITQPPGLVVKLFPLGLLRDADEYVRALLLQQMAERVLPGFLEKLMLDRNERGLPEALQCQNHAIWQQAVY